LVRNSQKAEMSEIRKEKESERNEFIITILVVNIGFGSWKEDWLQKKDRYQRRPGCRR